MNPLASTTYYLRHKTSALVQIAIIGLATVGVFVLVSVLDAVPLRANVSYLTKLSRVIPAGDALDPGIVSQVQAYPGVERAIPDNGLWVSLPALLGTDSQHLLGVSPEDAQVLMQYCGVRLKEGRMFEPRRNEFVLSEEVARALNLEIGAVIAREVDQRYYGAVSDPLVLVGTLEGDPNASTGPSVRLGFVSREYMRSHEFYAPRPTSLIVIAEPDRKAAVDEFLETTIDTQYADVETFAEIARFARMGRAMVYVVFGIVNSVVAVIVALVVGVINQIAITNRLGELGLLHALGHHKRRLVRRMTLETAVVACIGTLVGLGMALLAVSAIKNSLFYNLGMEMDLFNLAPFWFVLPMPAVVVALSYRSVRRTFALLDAVSIVERGHLSAEVPDGRQTAKRSSANPLSSLTFYLRHRRRGILLILSTALMVVGTTLPVFLLSAMTSAMRPYFEHLQYLGEVSPIQSELDPGVMGQIKSHPAVAYTIPTIRLAMWMVLPPGGGTDVRIYAVSEADLPILLESFSMQVQEGRLPRPRSNEIVLSSAIAVNRGLRVGDVVGGEADTDDSLIVDDLPIEMVVTGILSPDRPWVGFASYEYLRSHEIVSARTPRLLLVPREGHKQELDHWLEGSLASNRIGIATYATEEQEYREMTTSISLTFALLECMIAAVAAVALATLNYVFVLQRKAEFGVLNAIGRSRLWLLSRLIRETGSAAGVGWMVGVAVCGVGLIGVQMLFYAPRGLNLSLFNLIPWLFTTPLPVSIVLASAVTVARTLSRLDPVSIVERRA
ncbi:MAG TPA: FtsX-like permease family protein [Anaerolineae bacterium]|nr:FtsX-like permease family protein [Anaerolineae bacterium]